MIGFVQLPEPTVQALIEILSSLPTDATVKIAFDDLVAKKEKTIVLQSMIFNDKEVVLQTTDLGE